MANAVTHTLSETKFDVLCAVAEAAASRRHAALRDIAACCPTVNDVTPTLRALRADGLITLRGQTAGLTGRGVIVCRHL